MITKIDEHTITDAALEQMASTKDARLKEIMDSLVKHLHAFAREVDLTPQEWLDGISFLGLSSLVNHLHDRRAIEHGTKTSLLGPFYRQDGPSLPLGSRIFSKEEGPEIAIYGKVTDGAGRPLPGATVQIWQTDDEGAYDLQKDPTSMDLRGVFETDSHGNYSLRTLLPLGYMIPMDGPVGDMIRAQGRHGYRPAHIHFLISAPDYRELVTALYMREDDHIDSDTVFGVEDSLITMPKNGDPSSPFPNLPSIQFDFRLGVAAADGTGRVGADPSQISKATH
jgi:protocatechuate 3,4-dioxygenase beta subunit